MSTEGRRWLILLLIVRILSSKEVIKIWLFRNTVIGGGVTLCQSGYSAEGKPGVVFSFFY